jgi:sterol desaturase/sphingolipid hydroxylase (fatty acid hydroxylase superfamily)
MSNARTFLWLFIYVQAGFITLDLYEHWRLARGTSIRDSLRKNFPLIFAIAIACLAYFALQLALASTLPTISRVTDLANRIVSASSAEPNRLWTIPAFLAAFFTGTFFDYLVHRFLLHGPFFSLHENHHLPSVISNVMPGIAARPFVAIPNFLINLCSCAAIFTIVWLSGRRELIAVFITVLPSLLLTFAFVASASHSIFLRRFDWADTIFRCLLLISPREHLLHHAATLKGNYGNFTALWDHAFGTYVSPRGAGQFRLGLDYDQDFLGAVTAGRFKLSRTLRLRYQVGRICRLDAEANRARE